MPTFVLRLIAPRPNFAQTMNDAEREIMNCHAAHWRPYLERGDMVVFGPILTDDDSYGLAVVETDDDQALRDFAAQDPVATTAPRHSNSGGWPRGTSADADRRAAISRLARLVLGPGGLGTAICTTHCILIAHRSAPTATSSCQRRPNVKVTRILSG